MTKSKLKPALYYAFRTGFFNGMLFRLVAVTSTKGSYLWFGRDCEQNIATHGNLRDLKGRFSSLEEAMAAFEGLREIDKKYRPLLKANRIESTRLHNEQQEEERVYLLAGKSTS